MNLDVLNLLLAGAVVLISVLFSIVAFFLVRLINGVETRFGGVDAKQASTETRLAEHDRRHAVQDERHQTTLRELQRLDQEIRR